MTDEPGAGECYLPRNVVVSAERIRASDPASADEFIGMMLEAAGLAKRSAALRAQAWALFHTKVSKD